MLLSGAKNRRIMGKLIANPLVKFFDDYTSIIILGTAGLVAIFIMFDTRLTLEPKLFGFYLGRKTRRSKWWHRKQRLWTNDYSPSRRGRSGRYKIKKFLLRPLSLDKNEDAGGFFNALKGFTRRGKDFVPPPLSLLSKTRATELVILRLILIL